MSIFLLDSTFASQPTFCVCVCHAQHSSFYMHPSFACSVHGITNNRRSVSRIVCVYKRMKYKCALHTTIQTHPHTCSLSYIHWTSVLIHIYGQNTAVVQFFIVSTKWFFRFSICLTLKTEWNFWVCLISLNKLWCTISFKTFNEKSWKALSDPLELNIKEEILEFIYHWKIYKPNQKPKPKNMFAHGAQRHHNVPD